MGSDSRQTHSSEKSLQQGILFFDGSAQPNPGRGGCGWLVLDERGHEATRGSLRIAGALVTSNQAEYCGLLSGVRVAYAEGMRTLIIKGDSELVIEQMTGNYRVLNADLRAYYDLVKEELKRFRHVKFEHIPRSLNCVCDELAKSAIHATRGSGQQVLRLTWPNS
jgi:ribonuclease HI